MIARLTTFADRWLYLYAVAGLLLLLNASHLARELIESVHRSGLMHATAMLLATAAWSWLQCVGILLPAVLSRTALKLWSIALFGLSIAAAYFSYRMRLPIERDVLQAVAATDQTEVTEILDPVLIALLVIIGLPVSALLLRARMGAPLVVPWRWRTATTRITALTVLIAVILAAAQHVGRFDTIRTAQHNAQRFTAPFNMALASVRLTGLLWRSRHVQIVDIAPQFTYPQPALARAAAEVVIVVIGESARSLNFQINGYPRETNPRLSREADLVTIPDVIACRTMTAYSVPCLLSRIGSQDFSLPLAESSLVGILRHAGFETHWLSTQNSSRSPSTYQICQEAHHCRLGVTDPAGRDWDGALVTQVRATLQATKAPRLLFVLHTRGSHYVYSQRYPKEFAAFRPECLELPYSCDAAGLVNSYDNSIRYTDHVLAELVDILRDRSGALFFTSDHGESLGEKLIFGHGLPVTIAPREQLRVPMLLWMSPTFQAERGLRPEVIRNALAGRTIMHDHFFHTVVGCIGLRSPLLDDSLNLCAQPPGTPQVH